MAATHAVDRLRLAQHVDGGVDAVDELGEPAGELDVAAVDVVERQHAADEAEVVLGHRHTEEEAIQSGPPGVGGDGVELVRGAVRGVETPADPRGGDPLLDAGEVVVVEAEAAADRFAAGEVDDLRGGQPGVGESRAARRRRRAPAFVWRSDRSARRTRRSGRLLLSGRTCRIASSNSAAPNVAWMSGAKASMSGHMTMTSRGSSVGSSARRWRMASRSTST